MRVDDTRREELRERELSVRIAQDSLKMRKLNAVRFDLMKQSARQKQTLVAIKEESSDKRSSFVLSVLGARRRLQDSSRKLHSIGAEIKTLDEQVKKLGSKLNANLKKSHTIQDIIRGKRQLKGLRRNSKALSEQIESFIQTQCFSSADKEARPFPISTKEHLNTPVAIKELEKEPASVRGVVPLQEAGPMAESSLQNLTLLPESWTGQPNNQRNEESFAGDDQKNSLLPEREKAFEGLKERIEQLKSWHNHDAQGVTVSYLLKNGKKVLVEISCRAGNQFDVVISCAANRRSVLLEKAAILALMRQSGVEVKSLIVR
jgi:hypothetical protein